MASLIPVASFFRNFIFSDQPKQVEQQSPLAAPAPVINVTIAPTEPVDANRLRMLEQQQAIMQAHGQQKASLAQSAPAEQRMAPAMHMPLIMFVVARRHNNKLDYVKLSNQKDTEVITGFFSTLDSASQFRTRSEAVARLTAVLGVKKFSDQKTYHIRKVVAAHPMNLGVVPSANGIAPNYLVNCDCEHDQVDLDRRRYEKLSSQKNKLSSTKTAGKTNPVKTDFMNSFVPASAPVSEIKTQSGHTVKITENHPIVASVAPKKVATKTPTKIPAKYLSLGIVGLKKAKSSLQSKYGADKDYAQLVALLEKQYDPKAKAY